MFFNATQEEAPGPGGSGRAVAHVVRGPRVQVAVDATEDESTGRDVT